MSKKIIAMLLAVIMVVSVFAACGNNPAPTPDADNKGNTPANDKVDADNGDSDAVVETTGRTIVPGTKVILGNTTELSGDFRNPGWGGSSAGAADQDIWRLTAGYATMEVNQGGAYAWNETVVKNHTETENDDGTYTVTIELNEGLTFSDGTPIKAENYLAATLAFATPVAVQAGLSGTSGQALVGYQSYRNYKDPSAAGEGTKEFSGMRLLGDYEFSVTVSSAYYPYYFAYTYGNFSPDPMGLYLPEGVEIKDDGNGCYLSDSFYDGTESTDAEGNTTVDFVNAQHILDARYDVSKYPFSGPYVISEWDESTKQVTLTANPEYKGNFEGMTPAIETIVYTKIIEETQLELLQSGGVDVLSGITGGDETKAALAIVDGENFSEVHYQRAGYGKIEFECDFGPTMFQEVRQAVAYILNRTEFCQAFTGGYGVVVDGPYSPDFDMWQAVKDDITLIDYTYSPENAVRVLEEGGWIYNSKGEPFVEGATGVDSVRYKKLTAEQAEVLDDVNKTYASVANTDGITYQTVEINGEYYMPLVINWFGTSPNTVTDLLSTMLANSSDVAAAGMVIRATTGDFTKLLGEIYREPSYGYGGTPTYCMMNLATGWNSAVYDYAFNWSLDPLYFDYSSNKLYDEYDVAFPYDQAGEKLTYKEAMAASGNKLGMDYLSMAMVYNAKTVDEYNEWWMGYIERWNQLMPDIPLYSNYYYDVYNSKIENFKTTPFFGPSQAILYANCK